MLIIQTEKFETAVCRQDGATGSKCGTEADGWRVFLLVFKEHNNDERACTSLPISDSLTIILLILLCNIFAGLADAVDQGLGWIPPEVRVSKNYAMQVVPEIVCSLRISISKTLIDCEETEFAIGVVRVLAALYDGDPIEVVDLDEF